VGLDVGLEAAGIRGEFQGETHVESPIPVDDAGIEVEGIGDGDGEGLQPGGGLWKQGLLEFCFRWHGELVAGVVDYLLRLSCASKNGKQA
jgi:hypothetical protein